MFTSNWMGSNQNPIELCVNILSHTHTRTYTLLKSLFNRLTQQTNLHKQKSKRKKIYNGRTNDNQLQEQCECNK